MSYDNPYSIDRVAAADAALEERVAFLQRTYSLLLAGVFTFAATMWAAGSIPAVQSMMIGLWEVVSQGIVGMIVYFGIYLGGAMAVHALAQRSPINLVAYFAYTFVMGLLTAPIVLSVAATNADVLTQATLTTALVFSAATAYVFFSKKDFSFLRGTLSVMFWVLLIGPILGYFFGFTSVYWWSFAIVLFFTLYVLYDTSEILRRYPTNAHVSAACVLFVDVIMLFKHILFMLMHSDD